MPIEVKFNDSGREPKEKSDPKYPNGQDVSCAQLGQKSCTFNLSYPAPRCGTYSVICNDCKFTALITVAGRPDDPRTITLPCKVKLQ